MEFEHLLRTVEDGEKSDEWIGRVPKTLPKVETVKGNEGS